MPVPWQLRRTSSQLGDMVKEWVQIRSWKNWAPLPALQPVPRRCSNPSTQFHSTTTATSTYLAYQTITSLPLQAHCPKTTPYTAKLGVVFAGITNYFAHLSSIGTSRYYRGPTMFQYRMLLDHHPTRAHLCLATHGSPSGTPWSGTTIVTT